MADDDAGKRHLNPADLPRIQRQLDRHELHRALGRLTVLEDEIAELRQRICDELERLG